MGNRILFGAINASLLLLSPALQADKTDASVHELSEITVGASASGEVANDTESYAPKKAVSSATGLSMSLRETPQSVSVTTRTEMDDFGQNTMNDVLANTTGITVQKYETDRSEYNARGFDIDTFKYDGVGSPSGRPGVRGELDTALFERVEVIRGANGLMAGAGEPSAVVNFVRKRPTRDARASIGLTGGSWDTYRADGDLSGSLTDNVRARVVTAYRDGNSYLDRYEKERGVLYGVVEVDLTENTLFTVGYSRQEDNADQNMWGSLPLFYADGTPTDFSVSTSTGADWAFWDTVKEDAFFELAHQFDNGWEGKAVYQYRKWVGDSKLLYLFGNPTRDLDGMFAYPSKFQSYERQETVDLSARGPYEVGGRVHEMVIGFNRGKVRPKEMSIFADFGGSRFTPIDSEQVFTGDFPEPAFDGEQEGSDWVDRYLGGYLATRLNLADPLTAVVGARYQDVESEGEAYGATRTTSASELIPYAGVIFDLTEQHSLYTSYTTIFNPQTEQKPDGNRLDPIEGVNIEYGLKSEWFQGRLNTSLVAFETEQKNVAEEIDNGTPIAEYRGEDFDSGGYEAEVSGEVMRNWNISAGYSYLDIEDDDEGNELRTYIPEETFTLATTYRPAGLEKLKVGMTVNWQSTVTNTSGGNESKQESYALVNLMAGYDFTDNFNAKLRVNNVTDEKYLSSLRYFGQSYYGAPTNANLSLNYTF
ncbi:MULTISPECIES: TonB-dependent siderophore receptor [Alcanivorax]|jgi:outer membrane receptor for ferric coprogen and ferric-rhodotorulic acid|uniref:TonB-dependent siderophore receptor n=1 Tax=Alcanivorax TaxID=59753 RepID=UPI000C4E5E58|nr:TonB-dependent siderophore receptor [Alcanivorax jadensis]MBG32466.1 TonB-dependent siderophore receptor [Alcanivorax sp.]MDF1636904.1 TonB-dependent siderophore receptor [Alcanivorax jadensis]|tara:strand:- start:5500 stop:7620 length:2121 start_codon:yes stop_codon:yes gene_type:complete